MTYLQWNSAMNARLLSSTEKRYAIITLQYPLNGYSASPLMRWTRYPLNMLFDAVAFFFQLLVRIQGHFWYVFHFVFLLDPIILYIQYCSMFLKKSLVSDLSGCLSCITLLGGIGTPASGAFEIWMHHSCVCPPMSPPSPQFPLLLSPGMLSILQSYPSIDLLKSHKLMKGNKLPIQPHFHCGVFRVCWGWGLLQ